MDFLFRLAILAFGYFYPAHKCFKVLSCNKQKSEQLHVWCQYWIIIAVFTGLERVADVFFSWLPFYSGAKLMFVVYLWHPDTQGTEYIYQTLLKPLLSKHEDTIDLNWVHVRNGVVELVTLLWSNLLTHAQLKLSDLSHQNVLQSQQATSQLVHIDPSASYSRMSANLPLGQHQYYPIMTHSAILPHEKYQWASKVSGFPGQHKQTMHHLSGFTLPPAQKAALNKAPTPALTGYSSGDLKSHETKEELDFELVNSREVLESGAPDVKRSNISSQESRLRRWWWW